MTSSSQQTKKERVELHWSLRANRDGVEASLRDHNRRRICSFKDNKPVAIGSGQGYHLGKNFGTYINYDVSHSVEELATSWIPAEHIKLYSNGLEKVVEFGKYLQRKAELKFEWNKESLVKLEQRIPMVRRIDKQVFLDGQQDPLLEVYLEESQRLGHNKRGDRDYRNKGFEKIHHSKHRGEEKRGPVHRAIETDTPTFREKEKIIDEVLEMILRGKRAPAPQVTPREGRRSQRDR
ncbi:hypothetical protein BTUL_0002g01180 [Botrytis tulipae]|uniref:Uncharacterized protein n=1 Tax=Botrytis tulipae TaxID=87230 RepID=A0A4Z1FEQ1_9HELO|nr:hypothetical protein BTUL_0002g01180 [Botrytis tulipae]